MHFILIIKYINIYIGLYFFYYYNKIFINTFNITILKRVEKKHI